MLSKLKFNPFFPIVFGFLGIISCGLNSKAEVAQVVYYDIPATDTSMQNPLIAVTDQEHLELGVRVAYLNTAGDTLIPFGRYQYFGTDTLRYFAHVIEIKDDNSPVNLIAIDRNQNVLYDIVLFDNGPDYFHEGLVRVSRNGKMGFANPQGQIVIPCVYDFAWWFQGGKAKVTFKATEIQDQYGEHTRMESDEWFYIDKNGNAIE